MHHIHIVSDETERCLSFCDMTNPREEAFIDATIRIGDLVIDWNGNVYSVLGFTQDTVLFKHVEGDTQPGNAILECDEEYVSDNLTPI
jgi:hypothetical protein